VPVGLAENGRPAGIWMYSGFLDEPKLLAYAYDLEQELGDSLGETVGPVRWMDVDDANARAILLADNWIPSRGRNMPDELLEVMRGLREDAELFEATGADDDDVEALERDLADLDKPLKLDVKPKMRKITCPECNAKFEVKR